MQLNDPILAPPPGKLLTTVVLGPADKAEIIGVDRKSGHVYVAYTEQDRTAWDWVVYWTPEFAIGIGAAILVWSIWAIVRAVRTPRRRGRWYCTDCNYDCTDETSTGGFWSRCPECGRSLTDHRPARGTTRRRRVAWSIGCAVVAMTVAGVLLRQTLVRIPAWIAPGIAHAAWPGDWLARVDSRWHFQRLAETPSEWSVVKRFDIRTGAELGLVARSESGWTLVYPTISADGRRLALLAMRKVAGRQVEFASTGGMPPIGRHFSANPRDLQVRTFDLKTGERQTAPVAFAKLGEEWRIIGWSQNAERVYLHRETVLGRACVIYMLRPETGELREVDQFETAPLKLPGLYQALSRRFVAAEVGDTLLWAMVVDFRRGPSPSGLNIVVPGDAGPVVREVARTPESPVLWAAFGGDQNEVVLGLGGNRGQMAPAAVDVATGLATPLSSSEASLRAGARPEGAWRPVSDMLGASVENQRSTSAIYKRNATTFVLTTPRLTSRAQSADGSRVVVLDAWSSTTRYGWRTAVLEVYEVPRDTEKQPDW